MILIFIPDAVLMEDLVTQSMLDGNSRHALCVNFEKPKRLNQLLRFLNKIDVIDTNSVLFIPKKQIIYGLEPPATY